MAIWGAITTKFRSFRRIFPALLSLVILIQLVPFRASAAQFTDVTRSKYADYFDAINYVADNGIMTGATATTFDPDVFVNRGTFITTLYRYAGQPQSFASISFTDVPAGSWIYDAVRWGVKYGIVTGVTTTTFEPWTLITREQAMTFFYRFLVNYRGETAFTDRFISQCDDYASVSPYARTPMQWAVSNAMIFTGSSPAMLYPQSNVDRKYLAVFIFRFGQNVDGIRFGLDNFCFVNSLSNFRSYSAGRKLLTQKHYNILESTATSVELKGITEGMNEFKGACFGMSFSALLDKNGIIDFNANFAHAADTLYGVKSPVASSAGNHILVADKQSGLQFPLAESIINFYHLSQCMRTTRFDYHYINLNASESLEPLLSALRTYGAVLLEFTYETTLDDGMPTTVGHAILLYGMPKIPANKDYYEITFYDPNSTVEETLRVSFNCKNCYIPHNGGTIAPATIRYYADFFSFRALDVDGEYNSYSYTKSTLTEDELHELRMQNDAAMKGQTWLALDAVGDCSVTNAEGQTLTFRAGMPSGDIEILDHYFINTGSDEALRMFYRVPDSPSFTVCSDYENANFQMIWGWDYQTVTGKGIREICFTPDGVTVSGTAMEYEICMFAGLGTDREITAVAENASYTEVLRTQATTYHDNSSSGQSITSAYVTSDAPTEILLCSIVDDIVFVRANASANEAYLISDIASGSPVAVPYTPGGGDTE